MKYSSKILLIAVALMAVVVFASSTDAWKTAATAAEERTMFIRLPDRMKPRGFEARMRDGQLVGMVMVKHDESRVTMTEKTPPAGAQSCPQGEFLKCHETGAEKGVAQQICTCVKFGSATIISANF
jgi:hypothetical protein